MLYTIRKINTINTWEFQFTTTPDSEFIFDPLIHSSHFPGLPNDGFLCKEGLVSDYQGDTLAVFSYEESDIIRTEHNGDVVTKLTLVYATTTSDTTLLSYLNIPNMSSFDAFVWGQDVGDHELIKSQITDESLFVSWVKYIYPTDKDRIFALITEESVFCDWGVELGDRDAIRHHITTEPNAFRWAMIFPEERAPMKPLILDPMWIDIWNSEFPDDQIV